MSRGTFRLIDSDVREGAYGMRYTRALVDHDVHGRLLITQAFGGMELVRGGAYRWSHGKAYRFPAETKLENITSDPAEACSEWLEWSGNAVAKIAASVGL